MIKQISTLALVALMSSISMAQGQESQAKQALEKEKGVVQSACQAEATASGCEGKQVGEGLLKCIHQYKKEHRKDFKLSDGCKSAMKDLRASRQEVRSKKN